jgi:glutamate synthase (NADPH/NADH) large chain
VATQNTELRKRFTGKPEDIVNLFMFIAEDMREIMADLGFSSINEMIGRTDILNMRPAINHWKAQSIDLSKLLFQPKVKNNIAVFNCEKQDHGLDKALDHKLIELARMALENVSPVSIDSKIMNTHRAVGTMLSGFVAKAYGLKGLPDDTIHIKLEGSAGQSLGAWLAHGVTLELSGDANDYVGKGISGGRIVIYPAKESSLVPRENIIAGNTILYGGTSGEVFISGVVGERFAVRNSGAIAIVEGCGDHGCEYMTGGIVVVLGKTGRNFAAGMSGGIAYVFDETGDFESFCNMSMVEVTKVLDHEFVDFGKPGGVIDETIISRDLTRFDAQRLKSLVEKHLRYSGSLLASKILENWKDSLKNFVKVMPLEYLRVLTEKKHQSETAEKIKSINLMAGE